MQKFVRDKTEYPSFTSNFMDWMRCLSVNQENYFAWAKRGLWYDANWLPGSHHVYRDSDWPSLHAVSIPGLIKSGQGTVLCWTKWHSAFRHFCFPCRPEEGAISRGEKKRLSSHSPKWVHCIPPLSAHPFLLINFLPPRPASLLFSPFTRYPRGSSPVSREFLQQNFRFHGLLPSQRSHTIHRTPPFFMIVFCLSAGSFPLTFLNAPITTTWTPQPSPASPNFST